MPGLPQRDLPGKTSKRQQTRKTATTVQEKPISSEELDQLVSFFSAPEEEPDEDALIDGLKRWWPDARTGTLSSESRWSSRVIYKSRYDINSTGTDARVKFGKHKGKWLSDMAADPDELDYLRWMVDTGGADYGLAGLDELVRVARAYVFPLSPEAQVLLPRLPPAALAVEDKTKAPEPVDTGKIRDKRRKLRKNGLFVRSPGSK